MVGHNAEYMFTLNTASHLVEGVDLFPIGCESHESCVKVNKAANHKVLLTDTGLLGAAELPSPHHVAVTALHTETTSEDIKVLCLCEYCACVCVCTGTRYSPVMYVAFVISHGDCDISYFAEVKVQVVLVVVRGDPAYPHPTGLLSRNHSH